MYINLAETKIYDIVALQKEYSQKLMHSLKLMQITLLCIYSNVSMIT